MPTTTFYNRRIYDTDMGLPLSASMRVRDGLPEKEIINK
jgi:hypothetical protein